MVDEPPCRFCGGPAEQAPVCRACRADLPWNRCACPCCALPTPTGEACPDCLAAPPPVSRTVAPFVFAPPIAQLIHRLKYNRELADVRWLAAALAEHRQRLDAPLPEQLLPVPLHRRRLWQRGYNQAQVLATALGRRLHVPVRGGWLKRLRATPQQVGQSAEERRRSVKGAFAVSGAVEGRHVALVDDVMTTGATLYELARALRAAGAAEVECWVLARTP